MSNTASARQGEYPLRQRRWTRRLAWAAAALLAFWCLIWLAAPPLIKWQGQKIATEKLGRPVRIGAVQFKPWSLELTLRDVTIGGANPADPPQLAVSRLYVNLSLESALRLAPVAQAIEVDGPALRLSHLGGGHFDVDDVMERLTSSPKPPPDEKPARFALYDITVRDGRITFVDEPVQRTHEVRDLRLTLPFISNLPSQRKVHVAPQLAFTADGSRFDSSAQALPFDASRQTQARLRLERLDLAPYLVYQPASLPLRVTAGAIEADLRLTFHETPTPMLKIAGAINLSDAKVNDATGQEALAFERLAVNVSEARPLERVLHLASVELTAPRLLASRTAQGRINWIPAPGAPPAATLVKTAASAARASKAPPTPSAAATSADGGWRVTVNRAAIAQGDVRWRDARPASGPAAVRAAPFTLEAQNLTWPIRQAITFNGRAVLADTAADAQASRDRASTAASGKSAPNPTAAPFIAFRGQAQLPSAKVSVQAHGLPLRLAQPYLATFLKPRLTGVVDADADLAWGAPQSGGSGQGAGKRAGNDAPGLTVNAGKLAFSHLALLGNTGDADAAPRRDRRAGSQPDLPPGTLASIDALTLDGARLDLPGRSVAVDAVAVQAPRVRIVRERDGRWMFENWLAKPGADQSPGTQSPPWAVRVGHVAVADGGIGWRDRQPASGTVDVALSQLKLNARDFALDGRKPMPLELSALLAPRRGEPGTLSWRGTVGMAPVSAQGEVNAERLPLQAFEPYVADRLNIDVLRADASFKGKVDYAQHSAGPHLRLAGDARIEELRTTSHPGSAAANDSAPGQANADAKTAQPSRAALAPDTGAADGGIGEELLSWKQLRLAELQVQLDPDQAPQVAVRDSQLSDFYARIIVHPSGRINLQDLVKTAAPASAAASAASGANASPGAPVIRLGPTRLVNGRVAFSDHFIKPNYSANLEELNGSLGAFSSVTDPRAPQMADLQLAGRAESTAQLSVSGKLNPLAQPLALDIAAKVTDLELPPLSPYAIKYSGHGIERGKLSMDVAYKIAPDGQLTAANKLVLNQLQFGEQEPGAPASLPVALATTLLADSNGVIQLDLPISGSLNDPQFSLGPVIFKAVVGLIGKAVTAPFSLLARALGGGSGAGDLSQVPFAPGSAVLSGMAKAQLNQIAKAMTDRPRLRLTVIGTAQLNAERQGFKRERLLALVAAERRASRAGAAAPPASAASAPASDNADYPQLLRRLYRRADIPGKPRNLIGMTKDIPVAEIESLLLAQIKIGEADIRQLATQRAVAVKDYLLARRLGAERVFIGATRTDNTAVANGAKPPAAVAASAAAPATPRWTPHAELELGMR